MKKRWLLWLLFFGLALSLSACGSRLGANSWPGVTVADNTAYVAAGPAVYAFRVEDGSLLWAFTGGDARDFSAYAPPAFSTDRQIMVVGDYGGRLYALNPKNGTLKWSFDGPQSHFVATPLITNKTIYAPNADGTLYALDLQGEVLWTFEAGDPLWGTPTTDGERLYVPSLGHVLYAINPKDGSVIWQTRLDGALASQPTLVDGVLYVGTFANQVVAVQAEDGKVLWTAPASGWVWSAPAYADGTLFVGDLGGKIMALDAETGKEKWSVTQGGPVIGQPAVDNEALYFTTENGILIALTPEGKPLWQHNFDGKLYASPVVASDMLLVAPYKSTNFLVAMNTDGQIRWTLTTEAVESALKLLQEKK